MDCMLYMRELMTCNKDPTDGCMLYTRGRMICNHSNNIYMLIGSMFYVRELMYVNNNI